MGLGLSPGTAIDLRETSPVPGSIHHRAVCLRIHQRLGKHAFFHISIPDEVSTRKVRIHLQHRTPLFDRAIILS
jgi:hypothetical protein